MSNPNPNPYISRKINNLAPTDGIKDPQIRAFADSLANAWQLRNGNIGADDSERFITKQEWDYLAKNPVIRALAGIGQPGASPQEPGPDTSGPPPDPSIQGIINILTSGVTLFDFTEVRKASNELFASIYALTSQVRDQIATTDAELAKLEDGITQINTVDPSSTSPNALHLYGLKATVEDEKTGLAAATAGIIEIDKVSATSKSANAQKTAALSAIVEDPVNGNLRNRADIIAINTVEATSTSASAKQLSGLSASVGYDKNTGVAKATADIAALNTLTVDSSSANAQATKGMLVTFGDKNTRNIAAINEINEISADSASANARQLAGMVAYVGVKARIFVQAEANGQGPGMVPPHIGTINKGTASEYVLVLNDIWLNTSKNNQMMVWRGGGWVDGSDARIGLAAGGITTESSVRIRSDDALVKQLNLFWAQIGDATALVAGGSEVTIVNGNPKAVKFDQVQTALYIPGTTTVMSSAVTRGEYTAEVTKNGLAASTSYVLTLDARANGQKAIGGMALLAEVKPGATPTVSCVFSVDQFMIVHPTLPWAAMSPFSIENYIVRINAARIGSTIQSDAFVEETSTTAGQGWLIDRAGNSTFYGATTLGTVYSGSILKDRGSKYPMLSLAHGCYQGKELSGSPGQIHESGNLTFWGPAHHPNMTAERRLRNTKNNVVLVASFIFTGVVDDPLSIYYTYNNQPWQLLAETKADGDSYNPCSIAASIALGIHTDTDFVKFGFGCKNSQYPNGNGNNLIKSFSAVAVISNI